MRPSYSLLLASTVLGSVALAAIAPPAASQTCNLSDVKLVLHVSGSVTKAPCVYPSSGVTGFGCSHTQSSSLVTEGDLNTEYQVYLLAVDVPVAQGLTRVEVGIDYDGADNQGVDVLSWTLCADQGQYLNGWPATGGGMEFTFQGCAGSVSDPSDPEGDAGVLLGVFNVIAYSADQLAVHRLDYRSMPLLRYTDCTNTEYYLMDGNFGYAAFSASAGTPGYDPCLVITDYLGGTCCYPDGTSGPVSTSFCCTAAGGYFIPFTSGETCATPVEADTWSRLKSRYRD
jgi:hypothetical protein